MKEIIINNKKYKMVATVESVENLLMRFDVVNLHEQDPVLITKFYLYAIWTFVKPRFLFFKPFILKRRFFKKFDIEEFREINKTILPMIYGVSGDDLEKAADEAEEKKKKE